MIAHWCCWLVVRHRRPADRSSGFISSGIDISDAMLGVARTKNRFENLTFQRADATELPFDADRFDVAQEKE